MGWHMTRKAERNLRAAWYGPMTADAVARRFHQSSARAVRRFWETEKSAGRLPDAPRPHFVDCAAATAPVADVAIDIGLAVDRAADLALDREIAVAEANSDNPMDPRYAAAVYGCRVSDHDPLLARLIAVHGKDARRAVDDDCAAILDRRYDARGVMPSRAALHVIARNYDRIVTTRGKAAL